MSPKRVRGAKAKGLAYERKFGKYLETQRLGGKLFPHQWFGFIDANGEGIAQSDYFIRRRDEILLFECKLTQCDLAWDQLNHLYRPLLEMLFGLPVWSVLVCKNLREVPEGLITNLEDARDGTTFHWLGA